MVIYKFSERPPFNMLGDVEGESELFSYWNYAFAYRCADFFYKLSPHHEKWHQVSHFAFIEADGSIFVFALLHNQILHSPVTVNQSHAQHPRVPFVNTYMLNTKPSTQKIRCSGRKNFKTRQIPVVLKDVGCLDRSLEFEKVYPCLSLDALRYGLCYFAERQDPVR